MARKGLPPGTEQRPRDGVAVGQIMVEKLEQRPAVEPRHGEQPAGRKVREGLRHAHRSFVRQHPPVERGVAGLALVVELLAQPLAQLLGDLCRVDLGREAPLKPEDDAELAEVGLDRGLHVGILQLAGELRAVMGHRPVHLAERGGCGRRAVEAPEARLPVRSELRDHPAPDEGRPHRRRLGLELLHLHCIVGRQQVGDGREHLRDLHQRALQPAEGGGEVGGVARIAEAAPEKPRARDPRRRPADASAHARIARQAAGEAVLFGIVGHRVQCPTPSPPVRR
jgi:hypothetical protein